MMRFKQSSVPSLFTRMAGILALIVLCLPTGIYSLFAYTAASQQIKNNLHVHALVLEDYISHYPDTWQLATHRLQGKLESQKTDSARLRLLNNDGQILADLSSQTAGPFIADSRILYSFGQPVGQLQGTISVFQEILIGLFVFGGSLCLAWLIWIPLRGLPLDALAASNDALHSRDRYQRALLDNFPFVVWLKDLEGRYLAVNAKFAELCGQSSNENLDGTINHDAVPPELEAVIQSGNLAVIESGHAKQFEQLFEIHGEQRWFDIYKSPVSMHGQVIGTVGCARDITEWKRAEVELQIAATAFESQEGMFITDANKTILRVNRAFTKITGYSAEEVIGSPPGLLQSGRHDSSFYTCMHDMLENTGFWKGEIWNKRKNGEEYPQWLTIARVKDKEGNTTNYVATLTDNSHRKASEERIRNLSLYDPLTLLPNRQYLLDRMKHALAEKFHSGHEGALLFIDLDDFRTLNDTLGHEKGDLLLKQVAQRLTSCLRDGDTIARLGADEFVVMLEGLSNSPDEATRQSRYVGEKILSRLKPPFDLDGHEHYCSASIGITLFADHENSIDDLMKQADLAMFQAKSAGRNTLCFFDYNMQTMASTRATLESGLREALREQQFVLHYQPQVNEAGAVTGAEALVRWLHPSQGMISPADFIPIAEASGLILPIGQWVLDTACAQLAEWSKQPGLNQITLAVNVSAHQFRQPDFVNTVLTAVNQSRAPTDKLKLEITESMLLDNVEDIIVKMSELKEKGIGFSLDDFGTGYSSLSYLKRLPLEQLKIDKSFVGDVLTDSNDAVIAQTIIGLAQSLNLAVIAEGVETQEQLDFLVTNGCQAFQGYLFSRPLAVETFADFVLQENTPA